MKIQRDEAFRHLTAYLARTMEASGRPAVRDFRRGYDATSDTVEVSGLARHFQEMNRIVAEVPEINMERVNEVRAKIDAGQYRVEVESMAEALIRRAVIDRVLSL